MKAAKKMAAKPAAKPDVKLEAKPAAKAMRGLGKGLSALMSESYSHSVSAPGGAGQDGEKDGGQTLLPIASIRAGKYQPRGFFDEGALNELAGSIRKNGVMQPILVRQLGANQYEIIAGERRYRAAKLAGLEHVPVLVRPITDEQALELALVENVQRENLHPLEESAAYRRLIDEFGYTQETVSTTVHKSRSYIANLLRLLDLPSEVRDLFSGNQLTMGHARALMGVEPERAVMLASEIVRRNLTVRDTERLARSDRQMSEGPRTPRENRKDAPAPVAANTNQQQMPNFGPKDPDILALEETLSENLGLKVSINDRGQSGEIMIAYESLEQLDEILRRLGGSI